MTIIKIFFILVSFILTSFHSYANLLISPTRINFDERQRVAKVIVVNNSNEPKTYRLEWQEKVALAGGGYSNLAATQESSTSLKNMVRISPSQVRLAPGERQIVKLAIRKPKSLAKQEYRSHLAFKALPNETQAQQQRLGIKINLLLSYTIPVILRHGAEKPNVSISNLQLIHSAEKKAFEIEIKREGGFSSFGKLEVFFKQKGTDTEKKIAMLNDFSIYPELTKTIATIPIFAEQKSPENGQVRVTYTGLKEYRNTIFSEKLAPVNNAIIGKLK
ncbi:molecular chaperone [Pseudoalteromonas sp. MMG006]|uniref:fimbrial biogenesis chaperone n=1 Tax=Pseudoalteromonas sp. MMG006 TaxID=2822683 RepID=UPI001B377F59|nr:fimbria/pilus periplasmic chaperone [Pseudoalteromonas sp. MMG006]MBQ4799548.1 molecular chaperone [Pseudoalteromonas sp. MMG006]